MENHNDYEYWNNKGREYFAQNNFTDAIKCFEKVIEIKPDYYDVWYDIATAYYRQGEYDDAIK